MSSLIPVGLSELIEEATAEADRQVDAFVRGALKNVDISKGPWSSRLVDIRRDTRESAARKARVLAALNALNKAESVDESRMSVTELRTYLDATHAKLSEGVVLDDILCSKEPGSIMLRKEMNRQLSIIRMPVEILSMISQEYVADLWDESDLYSTSYHYRYASCPVQEKSGYLKACRISYICSDWRDLSLATGSLWSRLSLRWPQEAMREFLARSAGSPLEILARTQDLFRDPIDQGMFGNMTSLIMERTHLIKNLSMTLPSRTDDDTVPIATGVSRLWKSPFSKLRVLDLSFQDSYYHDTEDKYPCVGDLLLTSSPNLQKILLKRLTLPKMDGFGPLPYLTSLSMYEVGSLDGAFRFSDLVAFLSRMPNLEDLTLVHMSIGVSGSSSESGFAQTELIRCKKIELRLSSSFAPKQFLSAIVCPNVENLEFQCFPMDKNLLLSSYHALPRYIVDLITQCRYLCLKPDGICRGLKMTYFTSEGTNLAKDTPNFTFSERSDGNYQLGADTSQVIHPVIASITKLPLSGLTVLYIDRLIDHQPGHLIPSVGNWRLFFSALPSLNRLEMWRMKKMVTVNLCKALSDALSCPDLETLTIDYKSFNLKEVKKCLSQRKIFKVGLKTLNIKSDPGISTMRSIPCSYYLVECFTDCGDIENI
ncbi:hypothetical protein SISNIDRAFT_530279 [Sistotremastrum niveocremeum HHB9708]|uniref:F-box domain-containing protein n=1 Tax=Sistotremastrum niveocremeum HHB9708 TaxID=1314777 RepID=A0A164Z1S9_9AGAM|nr:hypothetical protein SISNIDRAFT_530279 [Sistotremastrum niveocremeum HHB9708]